MATFGEGTGPIVVGNISCMGAERDLLACMISGPNCLHSSDAGVRCQQDASEYFLITSMILETVVFLLFYISMCLLVVRKVYSLCTDHSSNWG